MRMQEAKRLQLPVGYSAALNENSVLDRGSIKNTPQRLLRKKQRHNEQHSEKQIGLR